MEKKKLYVIFDWSYGESNFQSVWETKELAEKEIERVKQWKLSCFPKEELTYDYIIKEYLRLKNGYKKDMSLQEYHFGFLGSNKSDKEVLEDVYKEKIESIKGEFEIKEVVLNEQ